MPDNEEFYGAETAPSVDIVRDFLGQKELQDLKTRLIKVISKEPDEIPPWMHLVMPKVAARMQNAYEYSLTSAYRKLQALNLLEQMSGKEKPMPFKFEDVTTPAPLPGEGKGIFPIGAEIPTGEKKPSLDWGKISQEGITTSQMPAMIQAQTWTKGFQPEEVGIHYGEGEEGPWAGETKVEKGKAPKTWQLGIKGKGEEKPLSDIGKLQHDKEKLLKQGFELDHPAIKAIDAEMVKKSIATEKNKTPFLDPKGNTVLVDLSAPDAQKIIDQNKLKPVSYEAAGLRANIFNVLPVAGVPGIYQTKRDPVTGQSKFYENTPEGPRELNTQEVQQMGLAYQEQKPTETTKTMQQIAPKVLDLANRVKEDLQAVGKLGPAAGRYREFWAGKVGSADPSYYKLRTDVGLLSTLLMRMHVGARGGVQIMDHFKSMFDAGKESPENMNAAVDTIIDYANEVKQPLIKPSGTSQSPTVTPREQAISELKRRGKIVNEETIKRAMELMRGK